MARVAASPRRADRRVRRPDSKNRTQPEPLPGTRGALRPCQGIFKARNAGRRNAFLTGVPRFARIRILPVLTSWQLSLPACGDLLGFTAEDLDRYPAPYPEDMAKGQRRRRRDARQTLQMPRVFRNSFRACPSLKLACRPATRGRLAPPPALRHGRDILVSIPGRI